MQKFRKKPVVIEAQQVTESDFGFEPNHVPGVTYCMSTKTISIETLEGTMTGEIGDWIIRGILGELYPCKPGIFEATYEPEGS